MERRFKIALISSNEVVNYGENLREAVMNNMPKGTEILRNEDDFETASLKMLLYNETWDIVPFGETLETFVIILGEKTESKPVPAYAH